MSYLLQLCIQTTDNIDYVRLTMLETDRIPEIWKQYATSLVEYNYSDLLSVYFRVIPLHKITGTDGQEFEFYTYKDNVKKEVLLKSTKTLDEQIKKLTAEAIAIRDANPDEPDEAVKEYNRLVRRIKTLKRYKEQ